MQPDALELLRSGALTTEHLAALRPVADKPGADRLLASGVGMSPEDFGRVVQQFRLAFEHGENVAARQQAARSLRFSNGPDGMVRLRGLCPPLPGATLQTILGAIREANYRRDHPERARVLGGHETDTRDQRLADALLERAGVTPSVARTRPVSEHAHTADSGTDDRAETDGAPEGAPDDGVDDWQRNVPADRPPIRVTTSKPATVIVFNVERYQAEMLNHGPYRSPRRCSIM